MRVRRFIVASFGVASFLAGSTARASAAHPQTISLPTIAANDNRTSAGRLQNGVLTIRVEARMARWYPEEEGGASLDVYAFGEEGKPLQIPGPLIRVPQDTVLAVSVRNAIEGVTLTVHGLHARPGGPDDTLEVPSGETRTVRFPAGASGTYFYWARTANSSIALRPRVESQLSGALIVDPPRRPEQKLAAEDRVFVIGVWAIPANSKASPPVRFREVTVINGKSWPHTERLNYTVGDVVHWRVINASGAFHPMHLHGFFYRVESVGDAERDALYAKSQQPMVVTERMAPRTTMSISWSPTRPGNWLFHCHMIPHISPEVRVDPAQATARHAANEQSHALEAMAGLVLGIHVRPASAAPRPALARGKRRELQLVVESKPRPGRSPGLGLWLEERFKKGPADAGKIPGPPIILTRGQPVSIRVVNHLDEPTTVHWHGIELESYNDGVAGWSGIANRLAPPIPAGASFVAEFTPPRAGTFIYHSHMDDLHQLSSGFYGALIVLPPGQSFDPETDRILVLGLGEPSDNAPVLLNGKGQPEPIELRAGVKYRFRFINITPADPRLVISLLSGGKPVSWRAVAKDGAELPATQATVRPALQEMAVGETYDFEFQPASPGELLFDVF